MTKFFTTSLLAIACYLSAPQCHAEPIGPEPAELVTINDFQLSITADSSTFAVNTPVRIDTFIKNVTEKPRAFAMNSDSADYRIEVTTDKGEKLPLTRYGKYFGSNKTSFFGRGPFDVAPGKSYNSKFVINQIYDMTLPGDYMVKVSHYIKFPNEKGAKEATSNTLNITVQ